MSIETNCFRINGLASLLTEYRLFQILGVQRETPGYYSNVQRIVRQLSFQLRAPVTTYDEGAETFLVVPRGYAEPPSHIRLVGAVATLKDTGRCIELKFDASSDDLDSVRIRFLQFAFQNPLWGDTRLWQPGAGKPFFLRQPARQLGSLDLYEGFAARVAHHPEGGLGIIVDVRRKLVSRNALPATITRDHVNRIKGRSCLYKMGNTWFEVTVSGLADRSVGDPSINLDGRTVSLGHYLHTKSPKPVPASIANLKTDGAAIYYRTHGPDQKSAPAELCFLIEDTHGTEGARHQRETHIAPAERHRQISDFVGRFLANIRVGNSTLTVSHTPGRSNVVACSVPRLRFGQGSTLEPDRKTGKSTSIRDYARRRLALLTDKRAGFYVCSPLERQYLVLPRSISNGCGGQFLLDLKGQIEALSTGGGAYEPELIEYDDLNGSRDFVGQSRAIKAALTDASTKPGSALVMVHRYDRRPRSADQLAAWTVKEFKRQFDLTASVIHTDVVKCAYAGESREGKTEYVVRLQEAKRLNGYLRNVALNKILLTNGKWPFVLDTPLHADVVIGIDVKQSTAAFTLIANQGRIIRFQTSPSRQKEQLLKNQVAKYVYDLIQKETAYLERPPRQIVVHRDGRAWLSEIEGIRAACDKLAADGIVGNDWAVTVLEISKSSPASVRHFFVRPAGAGQKPFVDNPLIGAWSSATPDEAYVSTTGGPFHIPGTAKPLHVRRAAGAMPIRDCIDDVFALSCLAWPRPEGPMRLPISIKLCDRSLFEEAADYDEDALEFDDSELTGAAG